MLASLKYGQEPPAVGNWGQWWRRDILVDHEGVSVVAECVLATGDLVAAPLGELDRAADVDNGNSVDAETLNDNSWSFSESGEGEAATMATVPRAPRSWAIRIVSSAQVMVVDDR